jgi:Trk K+ transport system NAD-binding subunit
VKAIVIGCGRVGSTVAHQLHEEGWDVVAVVVATDGDNTNIVVGQVVQKRFGIDCVVVRLLDPARAEFYEQQGMRTVCPTSNAIDRLTDAVRACDVPQPVKISG